MSDERTPLLQQSEEANGLEYHTQFCQLVGTRPHNLPEDQDHSAHPHSLYQRAVKQRNKQQRTYMFTATLTNTLLLSQVVLGAALTGLGASDSSHILITIFGALNTVIAGLIAFLKSRGQPMRARMYRDDLERVVDEIENSAVMWLGISKHSHGYDAIDTDEQVTVRGEVARLTRLYDRAVKTNTLNDPDTYSFGAPGDPHSAALRAKAAIAPPVPPPDATVAAAAPAPQVVEDASPATTTTPEPAKLNPEDSPMQDAESGTSDSKDVDDAKKEPKDDENIPKESGGGESTPVSNPESQKSDAKLQPPPTAPQDPDASPASAAQV